LVERKELMAELKSDDQLEHVYQQAETVAVVGAHPDPNKPAHFVPDYLQKQGYKIIPVNPKYLGQELWGEAPRATLGEINVTVDVVEVFRRSEALPEHLDEILAMDPKPKVVWFQKGIRNDGVARRLIAAGIDVVQDRCMYEEHRRLFS
jgi:predicted CoA-binding protein